MLVVGTAWGINYVPFHHRDDTSVGGGALRALDGSRGVGCLVCILVALDSVVAGYPTLAMQFASCCCSLFTEGSKPTNALYND